MWQLELEEVTVETCMGKSFDIIIRHQLDPVWNQLVWNRYMSYTIVSIPFPLPHRAPRQGSLYMI